MPDNAYFGQAQIMIGGSEVPQTVYDDLARVEVEDSLFLPSSFTIELYDAELDWVDNALFDLGKEVTIKFKSGTGAPVVAIMGEITSVEPVIMVDSPYRLVVRGYHKVHRLHHRNQVKNYLKLKDSDFAKQLAGRAGLSPDLEATSVVHESVIQDNLTDWEFLCGRARRIGYVLMGRDGKLIFKSLATILSTATVTEVSLLAHIIEFFPRYTGIGSQKQVQVQGWNVATKTAINGTFNGSQVSTTGWPQGSGKAQGAFSVSGAWVSTGQAVAAADDAQSIAKGLAMDVAGGDIQAEGVIVGNPAVKAGGILKVSGVGTRFSGNYFLSHVVHRLTPIDGYRTEFRVSGTSPETLESLLAGGAAHRNGTSAQRTHAIAIVTNNNDPKNMCRVKVKYPWLSNDQESDWIRMASPMAGAGRGLQILPEVNDEILVAFEHGDLNQPIMIGALWNGKDAPPLTSSAATSGGKVNQRQFKTRKGHIVTFDDTDSGEKISIIDKTGKNKIEFDSVKNTITIEAQDKIVMKAKDIEITAQQNLTMKANNITVQSQANTKVEASANLEMKGTAGVKIESSATMGLKAMAALNIESTATASFKANAPLTIESTAITSVKGSMLKLN